MENNGEHEFILLILAFLPATGPTLLYSPHLVTVHKLAVGVRSCPSTPSERLSPHRRFSADRALGLLQKPTPFLLFHTPLAGVSRPSGCRGASRSGKDMRPRACALLTPIPLAPSVPSRLKQELRRVAHLAPDQRPQAVPKPSPPPLSR